MSTDFHTALKIFELRIKRREFVDSFHIARETVKLLRLSYNKSAGSREVGFRLEAAIKLLQARFADEAIVMNVCDYTRAQLIDESKHAAAAERPISASRSCILDMLTTFNDDSSLEDSDDNVKGAMNEVFNDIEQTLDMAYTSIGSFAPGLIHSRDVVLTIGYSGTVLAFLAQVPDITVFVVERSPEDDGHKMAEQLQKRGVRVIVIPDAAVFSVLPKVHRIVISARLVLSNGGIVGCSLTSALALAARHHSVPLIVLYWQMKMTTRVNHRVGRTYATLKPPLDIGHPEVVTLNPDGEYVPPDMITLLVNEDGPHCPAAVYANSQKTYEQHGNFC